MVMDKQNKGPHDISPQPGQPIDEPTGYAYFATCARGVEPLLAQELWDLGVRQIELGLGGVHFYGPLEFLYLANLGARTAIRVLLPLMEFEIYHQDDLYEAVYHYPWEDHMTADHTLAVDCNLRDSIYTHSQYALLRVKDAICDRFRDNTGRRPSIDREKPMIAINLHMNRNQVVVSLDTSWESLHKRGYRPIQPRAPLNEALAAAILLRAGYQGQTPIYDPMCGAATLPIEAAWIATNRAPGLTRKWYAFQGWLNHDIGMFAKVRSELREKIRPKLANPVVGADERSDAVHLSHEAAKLAGVNNLIDFRVEALGQGLPPEGPPGWVVCNPPYGVRLGTANVLRETYKKLGGLVTGPWKGWSLALFTATPELAQETGLKFPQRWSYPNGALRCHLYLWGPHVPNLEGEQQNDPGEDPMVQQRNQDQNEMPFDD